MASRAFTPSQGAADAWASRPVKCTSKWETARQAAVRRSAGHGWIIMAACTPSKAPRSNMKILPPPPSSAGVPSTRTCDSDLISHRRQGQPGTDGRGGNDVVPAGVAHVGQGVVFGAHGHHQFTCP